MIKNNIYENTLNFFKNNNLQQKIDRLAVLYKNKKIILYGMGQAFDVILENFDISNLNIIAVADKKFSKGDIDKYKGFKAISHTMIHLYNPDIVLVTMLEHYIVKTFFEKEFFTKGHFFCYQGIIEPSFEELFKKLW